MDRLDILKVLYQNMSAASLAIHIINQLKHSQDRAKEDEKCDIHETEVEGATLHHNHSDIWLWLKLCVMAWVYDCTASGISSMVWRW